MWPFKKKLTDLGGAGLLTGFTDWHSHILPGVDDGVPTLDKSLAILDFYDKAGVKELWLTPHIMEDYPNTPERLAERFAELKEAYKGPIKLNLAAEHMLDSLFQERLDEKRVMPIGKEGNHLLVETSYFNPPMDFDTMIEEIFSAGYFPLLAHPERYRYMDEAKYESLRERGVLFQMNFISLVGGYGTLAQSKAEWLLKKGMIDVLGSDVHRLEVVTNMVTAAPRKNEHLERLLEVASKPRIS